MPAELESVYRAEFKPLWRLVARLGIPAPFVEDVVHDVFLVAHRRWSTYDPSRPARAWLFGIAYKLASDFRALKRHTHEVSDEVASAAAAAPVSRDADRRDAARLLSRALAAMSFEARAVFVMHELEGRPVPEIAELVGVPVPTAYTRLRAARQTFSAVVAQQEPVHG